MADNGEVAKWQLDLSAGFRATQADRQIESLATRKAELLIRLLAEVPGQVRSRSDLASILWPDQSSATSRISLRQAVHVIRKSFGDTDVLGGGVTGLCLNTGRVEVVSRATTPFPVVDEEQNAVKGLFAAVAWLADHNPLRALEMLAAGGEIASLADSLEYRHLARPLLAKNSPSIAYARVLFQLAVGNRMQGQIEQGQRQLNRAFGIASEFNDDSLAFDCLFSLIFWQRDAGNYRQSLETVSHARSRLKATATVGQARISHAESCTIWHTGNPQYAAGQIRAVHSVLKDTNAQSDFVHCSYNLGTVSYEIGDRKTISTVVETGQPAAELIGDWRSAAIFDYVNALGLIIDRQPDTARDALRKHWNEMVPRGFGLTMPQTYEAVAEAALLDGNEEQAGEMLTRAHSYRSRHGYVWSPTERKRLRAPIARVVSRFSPKRIAAWTAAQQQLESLDCRRMACPF